MYVENVIKNNVLIFLFLCGYLIAIALGWLLLQHPLCQKLPLCQLDLLFTAISAVSTTGLAPIDIGNAFSFFGQFILLFLIQLGGLGYMIFSSFLVLYLASTTSHHSLSSNQEATQYPNPTRTRSFVRRLFFFSSLPPSLTQLIKQVFLYAFVCELCGLLLLFFLFRIEGIDHALWNSLFLSISAFCTAGFSLFSSNLEGYHNHLAINLVLSLFSLLGAFGLFFWIDFFKEAFSSLSSRTLWIDFFFRIIQPFCTVAIFIGIIAFLLLTTLPEESSYLQKLVISAFQVISTITTTGFNTIEIRSFPVAIHWILILFMLFAVCLTGNGKNLKGTSLKGLLTLGKYTLRDPIHSLWGQKCLLKRTKIALSAFVTYAFTLLGSALILKGIERQPFFSLLFETASALSTVGISIGITPELSPFGKAFLAFLMLTGRTTILVLGFIFSIKTHSESKFRGALPNP